MINLAGGEANPLSSDLTVLAECSDLDMGVRELPNENHNVMRTTDIRSGKSQNGKSAAKAPGRDS
jgi:hypothetical protein